MASNTLVTITYSVADAKRAELESILRGLVERINGAQQSVRFSVYREEDDHSSFTEIYECDSADAYEALEDSLDEETSRQIRRIATDYAKARQVFKTWEKLA